MRTWRQLFNTVYRYVLKGICSDEETYYQFTLASIKCTFQKLVSKILQDHLSLTFDYMVEVSPPWLVNTWVHHCAMDVQKPQLASSSKRDEEATECLKKVDLLSKQNYFKLGQFF